jgi:hypothetical protein
LPLPLSNITNSPPISILAYCLASISMTVTNKYCVSGANWNLNFFYLAIQVCTSLRNRRTGETNSCVVSCVHYCYCNLQAVGLDQESGAFRFEKGKDL